MHDTISVTDSGITVPDRLPHSDTAKVRRPKAPAAGHRAVRGASLLACFDSAAAIGAVLVVVIGTHASVLADGLGGLLAQRVSVRNVLLLALIAAAWPIIYRVCGLYDARFIQRVGSEVRRLIAAATIGTSVLLIVQLTSAHAVLAAIDVRQFWLASMALGLAVRLARQAVEQACQPHVPRVLIVGTGRLARRVYRDLRSSRVERHDFVGFLDEPAGSAPEFDRVQQKTIGTLEQLEDILMQQVVDEVFIALPVKSRYQQIQHLIGVCERAGVQAKYGADLFDSTVALPRYAAEGDRAFVAMQVAPEGYRLAVKRAVDIAGAAIGLVLLAPVFLLIAIAIKLTSAGPVIYAQDRCGFNKRPLRMLKFRSMYANADERQAALESRNEASGPVFKIRDDPRITPLGRWLRRSSLDELPQLWNVLRGDMSLVGPRPLPWRDVRRITRPSDMRRFSMKPGLTCLWQVRGRSKLSFERWVELDLEYIDNWSLALDARILLMTVPAVVSGNGAT